MNCKAMPRVPQMLVAMLLAMTAVQAWAAEAPAVTPAPAPAPAPAPTPERPAAYGQAQDLMAKGKLAEAHTVLVKLQSQDLAADDKRAVAELLGQVDDQLAATVTDAAAARERAAATVEARKQANVDFEARQKALLKEGDELLLGNPDVARARYNQVAVNRVDRALDQSMDFLDQAQYDKGAGILAKIRSFADSGKITLPAEVTAKLEKAEVRAANGPANYATGEQVIAARREAARILAEKRDKVREIVAEARRLYEQRDYAAALQQIDKTATVDVDKGPALENEVSSLRQQIVAAFEQQKALEARLAQNETERRGKALEFRKKLTEAEQARQLAESLNFLGGQ